MPAVGGGVGGMRVPARPIGVDAPRDETAGDSGSGGGAGKPVDALPGPAAGIGAGGGSGGGPGKGLEALTRID